MLLLSFCNISSLVMLLSFMSQNFGWGATGDNSIMFVFGNGGNGKSTFFRIFNKLLGNMSDYLEKSVVTKIFNGGDGQSAKPFLVPLLCKKVLFGSDISNGFLDSNFIKMWTGFLLFFYLCILGNEKIKARKLYSNNIISTFSPPKLLIGTNHLPKFDLCDEALKRRLKVVFFEKVFVCLCK